MGVPPQLLSDIKSVLKYSFQVRTKTISDIQFMTLRTAIRYNVNMPVYKINNRGLAGIYQSRFVQIGKNKYFILQ